MYTLHYIYQPDKYNVFLLNYNYLLSLIYRLEYTRNSSLKGQISKRTNELQYSFIFLEYLSTIIRHNYKAIPGTIYNFKTNINIYIQKEYLY